MISQCVNLETSFSLSEYNMVFFFSIESKYLDYFEHQLK